MGASLCSDDCGVWNSSTDAEGISDGLAGDAVPAQLPLARSRSTAGAIQPCDSGKGMWVRRIRRSEWHAADEGTAGGVLRLMPRRMGSGVRRGGNRMIV